MDIKLILHPTDGSESAKKALAVAADLARVNGAGILTLNVQPKHGSAQVPPGLKEWAELEHVYVTDETLLMQQATAIAEQAAEHARSIGVADVEALALEGDPTRRIVETAEHRGADMIVMGSRGLGDMKGLLLGSVSHKVVHLSPTTCVIVR